MGKPRKAFEEALSKEAAPVKRDKFSVKLDVTVIPDYSFGAYRRNGPLEVDQYLVMIKSNTGESLDIYVDANGDPLRPTPKPIYLLQAVREAVRESIKRLSR